MAWYILPVTQLSPIRGYAELLADPDCTLSDERRFQYGNAILRNTEHAEKLVNDLKLTYQLKNNMLPLAMKKPSLTRFLRETVIEVLNHPQYSTLIVMAASLLLTAFLFGLPAMQYQTYNGGGVIKGAEGIRHQKAQHESQFVSLTDEYITETISQYQSLFENPDNVGYGSNETFLIGDAYWDFVAPRTKLLNIIAGNYDTPGESSGYNKLPDLDMEKQS